MDFDNDDDHDDEMSMPVPVPLPISSNYDPPQIFNISSRAPPITGGTGGSSTSSGIFGNLTHSVRKPTCNTPSAAAPAGVTKYKECLKNHAVGIGGHAVDGCGEFMPAGDDGSLDALRCAACNCHRNFHRKETPQDITPTGVNAQMNYHQHSQFSPYYRTPAAYLQNYAAGGVGGGTMALPRSNRPPQTLALPSTSGGRSTGDEDIEFPKMMMDSGAGVSGSKKRFRTKFSQEQKDRMLAFAEAVGWRIQKHDEIAVQQLCDETGIKRNVLKVWMHNNKHTLAKKPSN